MESPETPRFETEPPFVPVEQPSPACAVSNRLTPDLIGATCEAECDAAGIPIWREHGWTPDKVRTFLNALADCGVVSDAARAAGMSRQSAYNLRNRTASRAFHLAWAAAELRARQRLSDELMSRAIHGCKQVTIRNGKVREERHRFDNRLGLAMLSRLDRKAEARDSESVAVRMVSQEFDQFLDLLCCPPEGQTFDRFIAVRDGVIHFDPAGPDRALLERARNYRRYGAGHPDEIPTDDLERTPRDEWTEEQWDRARAAEWVDDDSHADRPAASTPDAADNAPEVE